MRNDFNIKRGYEFTLKRGWNRWFFAIDLHDTICKANYSEEVPDDFFPMAKETLQYMSQRKDIGLILYTCSYMEELRKPGGTLEWLGSNGIFFDYLNENPEAPNTKLGDFSKKMFANVVLDDKAGFEGEKDWQLIWDILQECPEIK